MTSRNDQLWELISTHQMPANASGISFTEQLMREHGIKWDTAITAIEEYRKFIYLCVTRTERNVPSKAVDLVWHLHMQHSRDYWDVFCRKLGKPIHHTPGGEGRTHLDDYKATMAAYRNVFGTPPRGIWRQQHRGGSMVALLFVSIFLVIGLRMMLDPEVPVLPALMFIGIPGFMILQIARGLTPRGEFELTFVADDPFADNDAGDCGSGDGGGCGD